MCKVKAYAIVGGRKLWIEKNILKRDLALEYLSFHARPTNMIVIVSKRVGLLRWHESSYKISLSGNENAYHILKALTKRMLPPEKD